MYSHNTKLLTLLKRAQHSTPKELKAIRLQTYKLLKRNYKRLNNMGISQVHFHTNDNKSFLRMYAPEQFGDDLSNIKKSVVLTNKTLTPHEGFEACRFMIGMRFVYPLFDKNNKHLGSVGITFSSRHILKSIIDDFVYDAHILISKSIANDTIMQKEYLSSYEPTWETPDYYIESSTHKTINNQNLYTKIDIKTLRGEIKEGIATEEPFSLAAIYNYQNIILTFLPMASADGIKNIAYIVTYTESDYLSNISLEKEYMIAMFISILTLLFLFSIYVILNREKLKELALYDYLTKLPNRTLFMIEFQNEINRAQRYKTKVALMFLDLDGFKAVNDTYGHQVGDLLLQKVAEILSSLIRKSDIASRLSGDEFTIILSDIQSEEQVLTLAKKIIQEINKDIVINHKVISIGASIGISIYPTSAFHVEELIKHADSMMYKSKENGKNQVTLYKKKENN
jgi:diguanylate cyclase (GGDEF)-like protein